MSETLISIKNLKTIYETNRGTVNAVDNVSFDINKDEVFGLVGESGCGKSTTAKSLLRLLPKPGKIVDGEVLLDGVDLVELSVKEIRKYRGKEISMIFQDPTSALNPVFKIGNQIVEAVKLHQELEGKKAWERAGELLEEVGIPSPNQRLKDYPHQFSGGMKQRAMIALALSCEPSLLVCDEATTNLDVTIQAKILRLIQKLQEEFRTSILYITHNLGVIAQISDRVGVMYAGKLVEKGPVKEIFQNPSHPYTAALLDAIPDPRYEVKKLEPIPGTVPQLIDAPAGCPFHPRCQHSTEICTREFPKRSTISPRHVVACHTPLKGGETQ